MTGVKIKPVKSAPPTVRPPTENQEQRALLKWIKLHPKIRDYVIKLNNEGKRSEAQGWNLKMMGMCPGASDLFIAYPVGKFHGLWLELKRNKKYCPSEMKTDSWIAQEEFHRKMKLVGYQCAFCYGCEDAIRVIERYLQDPDRS